MPAPALWRHELLIAAPACLAGNCMCHLRYLRQALEDDPAQSRHLLTQTAVGYRLLA